MNLRLHITQKETKDYLLAQRRFTVVDLDMSKDYPQPFVCILPINIKAGIKSSNIFEGLFGTDSIKIAKQLLEKGLKAKYDLETIRVIRDRLKQLTPRPKNIAKCINCSKDFEYRTYRFGRQKPCNDCLTQRATRY